MTFSGDLVRPPRVAIWLVNLFTPAEAAESILGDLIEEFSRLAGKSGVGVARNWYWRQSLKTMAHLIIGGFRSAPWSTTAAVGGGFLLMRVVSGLPEHAIFAVLHRYRVFDRHFEVYVFVASYGLGIGHLIAQMFVGCMVALAAKGREMAATMALSFVLLAMIAAALPWIARDWPAGDTMVWMLWTCAGPLAILAGGAIVRTRRSAPIVAASDV